MAQIRRVPLPLPTLILIRGESSIGKSLILVVLPDPTGMFLLLQILIFKEIRHSTSIYSVFSLMALWEPMREILFQPNRTHPVSNFLMARITQQLIGVTSPTPVQEVALYPAHTSISISRGGVTTIITMGIGEFIMMGQVIFIWSSPLFLNLPLM